MAGTISQRETKQGTRYLAQLPPSMGRKSKSFADKQEAERWLAAQQEPQPVQTLGEIPLAGESVSTATTEAATGILVSEALDRWLSGAVLKESVRQGYRRLAERWILPIAGGLPIDRVSADTVDQVLKAAPMNSTLQKVAGVLSGLLVWAEAHGHIQVNPYNRSQAKRLISLASRQTQPRESVDQVWSADQVRAFIDAEQNDTYRLLWALYAITGVRRGEALGVRWEECRLESGYLWIAENVTTVSGAPIVEPLPKGWKRRRAYVGPQLQEWLAERQQKTRGYVCPQPKTRGLEPLHPDTVTEVFNRRARALNLPHLGGPHGLRRTFATLADHMGTRERVVQEAMGHAPNMTQRYQKVSEQELKALAERMENLILC